MLGVAYDHPAPAAGAAALEYRRGRGPAIPDRQLPRIEQALLQGPAAHGFDGEVWSAPQVAEVIERVTGVRSTPARSSGCCATGQGARERLGGLGLMAALRCSGPCCGRWTAG